MNTKNEEYQIILDTRSEKFPRYSLVIPMYGVENYVFETLDTIAMQTLDPQLFEIILLNDGAKDASLNVAHNWCRQHQEYQLLLIDKENSGVSSTRNLGIELSRGTWVSFPDPDDLLDKSYLQEVDRFIEKKNRPGLNLIACNILRYFEATNSVRDTHILRFKFAGRNKVVNLLNSPHYIQLSAASAFYRRKHLIDHSVLFLDSLHASEDAIFNSEVLASSAEPLLGVVSTAKYLYRKRAAASSSVDTFRFRAEPYFDRFALGYLPLLQRYQPVDVPEWLSSLVLYEFHWLFAGEQAVSSKAMYLRSGIGADALELWSRVLQCFPEQRIFTYRSTSTMHEIRVLLAALRGNVEPEPRVSISQLDSHRNLMQLTYYFTGNLPEEEFFIRAKRINPVFTKIQTLDYFNQDILKKRIVWLPANSWLRVKIDNELKELVTGPYALPQYALTEDRIWKYYRGDAASEYPAAPEKLKTSRITPRVARKNFFTRVHSKITRILSEQWSLYLRHARIGLFKVRVKYLRSRFDLNLSSYDPAERQAIVKWFKKESNSRECRVKFANSWLLSDRLNQAQDNAEHLYRFLINEVKQVRTFYLLNPDSSDWDRLAKEGFKLLQPGTYDYVIAVLNARHIISSHADVEMIVPLPRFYGRPRRVPQFTFLQHGVIKSDLSAWLNTKPIDLFVTTTQSEQDSIAGDGTPYKFSGKEVQRLGLARHDRLFELAQTIAPRTILVAPTWRHSLMEAKVAYRNGRNVVEDFYESNYFVSWMNVLRSTKIRKYVEANDLRLIFLPHPNFAEAFSSVVMPEHVRVASYQEDVQRLIAEAKVLVTDTSSLSFDAAFINRGVLYFHFDFEEMMAGGHTTLPGYYSDQDNGFGPVVEDIDTLTEFVCSEAYNDAMYAERRLEAFGERDAGARRRTYEAIRRLGKVQRKV